MSLSQGDRDSRPGRGQPAEERPSARRFRHLQRLRGWLVLPPRAQGAGEGEEGPGAPGKGEAAATAAAAAEICVSVWVLFRNADSVAVITNSQSNLSSMSIAFAFPQGGRRIRRFGFPSQETKPKEEKEEQEP